MKFRRSGRPFACALLAPFLAVASAAEAAPATWTNLTSGLWRVSTNWANGVLPASGNPTWITNTGTKTVTIDAATPAANRAAPALTLRAPAGFTNTLLLADLTTNSPLSITSAYTNGPGGALIISNSVINATAATRFLVESGTATLESGLLDCRTVQLRIGRSGTGALLVKSGSVLADTLFIGDAVGAQGDLTMQGGAMDVTFSFTIAGPAGATGNVTVANAQFTGGDPATINKVGNSGVGELTLNSGGSATIASLSVGDGNTGRGTVQVNGGHLRVTSSITKLGNTGFGQLTLNGGSVDLDAAMVLGENSGATGVVSVAGGNFRVNGALDTEIGRSGAGQFNLSGGNATLFSRLIVAENPGSFGVVNVTGGELRVTNGLTAVGRLGTGTMTVSNATITLTNASVGRHAGGNGTLTLLPGGKVFQLDDLSIGRFSNSVGTVLVNGGLLSLTNDTIWVGREGIGTLTVSNGSVEARDLWVARSTVTTDPDTGLPVTNRPAGTFTLAAGSVLISSNMVVGTDSFSTGQVSVVGGTLIVTNLSKTALVVADSGTFALNGGRLVANNIFATNTSGQFLLNGGTLELSGGTYTFASGLVVASNATLAGCGTINGDVVNHGTILANCAGQTLVVGGSLNNLGTIIRTNGGAVAARPRLLGITKGVSSRTITSSSLIGLTYTLEYRNSLGETNWTAIPPSVAGTDAAITLTDSTAAPASRFYRVRGQ